MRISGLTVDPTPEDDVLALQIADDYAGELLGLGLDLNWQQPLEYGDTDPADTSGLTNEMVGPFKKLLFVQLCSAFGKPVPVAVGVTASEGMRTLENIVVVVPDAELPATLPFGSGNEFDYRDRKFYDEPATNNDALYVFKDDILNFSEDFRDWLVDAELVTVTWTTTDNGITIGATSINDENNIATAELTFVKAGGYTIEITATKTDSTDKLTRIQNFVIEDPSPIGTIGGAL